MSTLPVTPAQEPKKRPAWVVGGVTIVSFVALMWIIELFDSLSNHRLDDNGIRPLESDGLLGILFAPMLHANWDHLIANTVRTARMSACAARPITSGRRA
jgi:membrane associated rhomboid family serine protease